MKIIKIDDAMLEFDNFTRGKLSTRDLLDLRVRLVGKAIQFEDEWILCSERMPEEREWIGTKKFGTTISDEVYVTFETLDGKRFCDHIRFQNGKLSVSKRAEIDAISKGARVVAWRQMPSPYKGV